MEALDQITDEINKIQSENDNPQTGQRTVVSDIEKLKKIAQILETVGQAVIPAVVDGQINAQKSTGNSGAGLTAQSTGLKILQQQHHGAIGSNNEANAAPAPSPLTTQEDK